MLIVPLTEKTSWQNPPYLTLLLILANCLVFFLFQGDEAKQMGKVTEYYAFSGLPKIESPLYAEYLRQQGRNEELQKLKEAFGVLREEAIYWAIIGDQEFSRKLDNDEIVTPSQEIYQNWKTKRIRLAEITSGVFFFKYGYRPDKFRWYTPITYMFLHGGLMHLVGNMIFLWLVGSILELGSHRAAYLLGYLFTGYFSAMFFGWVYRGSTIPLVGASGAIAGLMGAFTVVYGLGRVKIFYSLGFLFGYAKVKALLILPLWIGNELFQLFFGGPSNVAFVGHLGGLLSGATLGFLQLKLRGPVAEEEFKEEKEYQAAARLEEGMTRLADMDLAGARPIFAEILEKNRKNLKALLQLYRIDKQNPQGVEYQKSASRLLNHLSRRREDFELLLETYREYNKLSHPGLSRELYNQLGLIFTANGHLGEAARIVSFLLKNHPAFPGVPGCLLALAKAFGRDGHQDKSQNCLKIICRNYPESPEFQSARQLLQSQE